MTVAEFYESIEPLRNEICWLQNELVLKQAEYKKIQEEYWNSKKEA